MFEGLSPTQQVAQLRRVAEGHPSFWVNYLLAAADMIEQLAAELERVKSPRERVRLKSDKER